MKSVFFIVFSASSKSCVYPNLHIIVYYLRGHDSSSEKYL